MLKKTIESDPIDQTRAVHMQMLLWTTAVKVKLWTVSPAKPGGTNCNSSTIPEQGNDKRLLSIFAIHREAQAFFPIEI
ncbi:MAG: hypothetical protein D3908_03270 [Candidatus Electrothrix sp. AUS4]|nr:hypothetical protein [Candidatus Electrothrix sp. AUS4]